MQNAGSSRTNDEHFALAFIAGLAAFLTWGLVPIYWKLLKQVPAPQILAHRFVWTIVFLALLLTCQRRCREVLANFTSARPALFCLSIMVGTNWLLFIWAVNVGRVLETSLGYFLTPVVNVLLGALVLREHLTRTQLTSVATACAGVLILAIGYGHFPWIAIGLCISFGLYGLLRKQSGTAAIAGLFIETTFCLPLALAYLLWQAQRGALVFGPSHLSISALLASTGVVTALPLVWFGYAARHLRLVMLGFLQYLSPTISLLLGVFLYRETFTIAHFVTFSLIWVALALVSTEALLRWRVKVSEITAESPLIEPGI